LVDTASAAAEAVQPIYQAAFLGGSVHYYKHQSSLEHFIKTNIDWLKVLPVGFFSVGLAMTQPHADEREKAKKLVSEFLQQTGLQPVKVRHVAGALKYTQYDFFKRLVERSLSKHLADSGDTAHDHEYTDWNDVEAFVDEVLAAAKLPGSAKKA